MAAMNENGITRGGHRLHRQCGGGLRGRLRPGGHQAVGLHDQPRPAGKTARSGALRRGGHPRQRQLRPDQADRRPVRAAPPPAARPRRQFHPRARIR
ncbi:MAG: hypothetical protein MZV64_60275 [Ignavibacteriales bacterium]|nr:hypothetical protein [Ignavibacteriales bacterium]